MVGMIFAAGYGTRLKPWTLSHPKALVPVAGVPALARVIESMRRAGVDGVVVNTHHFAEQIHDFLRPYGSFVAVSHEDVLLDTGGGLRRALPLLGSDTVLIHNADIMTTAPLREMAREHRESHNDATLLTGERRTSRFLLFDRRGLLDGYYRSETGPVDVDDVINATGAGYVPRCFDGVHVFSPSLFDALRDFAPDDTPFSIIDFYRDAARRRAIRNYDLPRGCRWFDVGKPETLASADKYFSQQS